MSLKESYNMRISSKKATLERQLALIEKELKSIERSAAFKKENAIARSLNNLMKKYSCTTKDLIAILQGNSSAPTKRVAKKSTKTRKPRKLKIYRNPKTGDTVETRGGNHRVLKAWKEKYEMSSLDSWLIEERE
jgi:polyphosphate kinase 2 (PPK2 family)